MPTHGREIKRDEDEINTADVYRNQDIIKDDEIWTEVEYELDGTKYCQYVPRYRTSKYFYRHVFPQEEVKVKGNQKKISRRANKQSRLLINRDVLI